MGAVGFDGNGAMVIRSVDEAPRLGVACQHFFVGESVAIFFTRGDHPNGGADAGDKCRGTGGGAPMVGDDQDIGFECFGPLL